MSQFNAHGWTILFYTDFRLQWENLTSRAIELKSRLEPEDFVRHPDVKLLKAVDVGIRDKISLDPFASHFALRKPLQKYGRLKKMGLPQRYRLFFRAFADQQAIVILWLGFPRKEGDRQDCYAVFSRMVANGKLPESYESLLVECNSTIEAESIEDELSLPNNLSPEYFPDLQQDREL
ncbi:type II toxin-antitoxin system YhaV family toxin [Chamaesiphon sp. VAR_48_metabat_403]|uniref:type II toxin-antitoxin system YhaV family toxin n=1 Tax=Chamaesiphon sp. VAR_48_metabat_403 TaxID=2964700 RepID=UPI00286E6978|nr:type II toxin-antitoxin system YhaV family toxin [Chamaesiphon sp. VAR_48_metabat_403]